MCNTGSAPAALRPATEEPLRPATGTFRQEVSGNTVDGSFELDLSADVGCLSLHVALHWPAFCDDVELTRPFRRD